MPKYKVVIEIEYAADLYHLQDFIEDVGGMIIDGHLKYEDPSFKYEVTEGK